MAPTNAELDKTVTEQSEINTAQEERIAALEAANTALSETLAGYQARLEALENKPSGDATFGDWLAVVLPKYFTNDKPAVIADHE